MLCSCGTDVEDGFNGSIVYDGVGPHMYEGSMAVNVLEKYLKNFIVLCYVCEDKLESSMDRAEVRRRERAEY